MSEEATIEALVKAVVGAIEPNSIQPIPSEGIPVEVARADEITDETIETHHEVIEAALAFANSEEPVSEKEPVTIYFEDVDGNMEKALQLVQNDGMYVAKAARESGVPVQQLEAVVKSMKERGELTMNWDLQKRGVDKPKLDEDGNVIEKKKRRFIDWNFTADEVKAAADAVKNGEYSVKAAHKVFKIPINDIKRAMKGEEVKGRICTPGFIRVRKHGNKLTEEEEKVVLEYGFALHKLKHPVTFKTMAPLAKQLLKLRNETLKDEAGWWVGFVKRHQEFEGFYHTPKALAELSKDRHHWAKLYFNRLVEVFETGEFFSKPSRIYACEIEQFEVERWESEGAMSVEVEMLVAANAVGYHVLPPCVVYANSNQDIPDFLGLPEAGFVAAEERKVSGAILTEWFRSVFLHYLPARSAEDPVMLIMRGTDEWLTPELITMAEQQFVHLVPTHPGVLKYLNPIHPLLHNLKEAYKDALSQYKQTELRKQADNPAKEAFFPVTFRKLFSSSFSMYEIQETFRTRGVFPLKPDEADLTLKEQPPEPKTKRFSKKLRVPEYYKSYKNMLKTDIIHVPRPRPRPLAGSLGIPMANVAASLMPANFTQLPVTYTAAGGLIMSPLGVPLQLNPLNPFAASSIVGATPVVNTSGAAVTTSIIGPSTVASNVLTTQPSILMNVMTPVSSSQTNPSCPKLSKVQEDKLTKAITPEVVNAVREVQKHNSELNTDKEVQKQNSELNTDKAVQKQDSKLSPVQAKCRKQLPMPPQTEEEKRDRLSKAFNKDVVNTVMEVKKHSETKIQKALEYEQNSVATKSAASPTPWTEVTETLVTSTVESNKTSSSESVETSDMLADSLQDESAMETNTSPASETVDSTGVTANESEDVSKKKVNSLVDSSQDVSSPPVVVTSTKESESNATREESVPPPDDASKREISGVDHSPKSPTTRSKARESVAASPSTRSQSESVDASKSENSGGVSSPMSPTTRSKARDSASPPPNTRSQSTISSPSTRSKSKSAAPPNMSTSSPDKGASAPNRSGVGTRNKQSVTSELLTAGVLGTNSDVEEVDEDDYYSPEVVSSDWDSDEDGERRGGRKIKLKRKRSPKAAAPKLKLAANVSVPNSVIDRIQLMISQNSSLLTSLDEEAEEKKKKPKEPEKKDNTDKTKDSAEERLSKAFSPDVLSSVLAVKQDLARRPKLPDPYQPVQLGAGANIVYKLPGGGHVLVPSIMPVGQQPIIINTMPIPSGMTLVPVSAATPKSDEKSKDEEDDAPTSKTETKSKEVQKRKRKTDTSIEKDDESEVDEKTSTRRTKSKKQSSKDQARNAKKKKSDVVADDSADNDYVPKSSKGQKADHVETLVRKSARKQAATPPDPEATKKDVSPKSENGGSKKLTGAQKRKANFLSRTSNAAGKEQAKKGRNEKPTGIQTRAKRLELTGTSKRTRSMKK